MILKLYVIYDKKSTEYGNPICDTNDALAMRRLQREISPQSLFSTHSSDFALYCIGLYDTLTGMITADAVPRHVDELTNIIGGNT